MENVQHLQTYGSVLTLDAEAGTLPRAYEIEETVAELLAIAKPNNPKSIILLGESGSGKTAAIYELVHRLREVPEGPWVVLRITPEEFMKGTRYSGDYESRVYTIIDQIKRPNKIILYLPNIASLAWVGKNVDRRSGLISLIGPYVERGEIRILGESTVDLFRHGYNQAPELRTLFQVVNHHAPNEERTDRILQNVAQEHGLSMPSSSLARLKELANYFLGSSTEPGRSVSLIRRIAAEATEEPGIIGNEDIYRAITSVSGVPLEVLNDAIPLARNKVRKFFSSRVIGQSEPVDAVVDLVTLIKAGLTDPSKPYGVFLFVGPTGVGKTELARTLATYLFGDANRLVRLDMSEFATYEGFQRLIGHSHNVSEPGILTSAVRDNPFSVFLFDEIEKAHPNIYNLCLQIFDAGRLTDTQGRTADFRNSIIILTSNIGSSIQITNFGFGKESQRGGEPETVLRELGNWFRPEFLNRLDRIVAFQALPLEVAEQIAKKEITQVMERSGLQRRNLTVDVEPDVFPILLSEGYSATYGARPLKRTIERRVLLPIARLVASGRVPKGSLLRLVAVAGRIRVYVEPPETPSSDANDAPTQLPQAHAEDFEKLMQEILELQSEASPMSIRRSELLADATSANFWQDETKSKRTLDEVYRIDGLLAELNELEKRCRQVLEQGETAGPVVHFRDQEQQWQHLQCKFTQISYLLQCQDATELGDAFVCLRRIWRRDSNLNSVRRLTKMYENYAKARGFQVEILDDRYQEDLKADHVTLQISGAGAYALLKGESGLHHLVKGKKSSPDDLQQRETVHVEVLPVPTEYAPFSDDIVSQEVLPLEGLKGKLGLRLRHDITLFHKPTMTSVHAWAGGTRSAVVERLLQLLLARVERKNQLGNSQTTPTVRRYRLGPTTLVRDEKTGLRTGRVDLVLKGELDRFLLPLLQR